MKLNLSSPTSIAAWHAVSPARHSQFLRFCLRTPAYERFWPAIAASRDLVAKQQEKQ